MRIIPPGKTLDRAAIGERIRVLILHICPTISDFARRYGLSLTALYEITRGQSIPSPQTLAILGDLLGCSVDFLLGVSTPESEPMEGYDAALLNVCAFRESWTRDQKLFLAYASMGLLSPPEEDQLRLRLGV